jgi:amidohydrolase
VKEGIGRTGLVAELGNQKGPIVGLRVDMDALPIEERTGLSYSSKTQGVMHACGHDLHTCIGLGVAKVLAMNKFTSSGVRILFQPAEEIAQGANWMKAENALEGLNSLFGVHVYPDLSVGKIGIKSGTFTAAAGELEIDIIGNGGHGARPHEAVDSIWIAAKVISGLQESISRSLDALNPVVISFGKVSGGNAFNVIAERVKLLGTVRCLDSALYEKLPVWIEQIVSNIASTYGAKALSRQRTVPKSLTLSAITLKAFPPETFPKLITTGLRASRLLLIDSCSPLITFAAIHIESTASCGLAPCPPFPIISISNSPAAAVNVPLLIPIFPTDKSG